jgi:hypothetical protein
VCAATKAEGATAVQTSAPRTAATATQCGVAAATTTTASASVWELILGLGYTKQEAFNCCLGVAPPPPYGISSWALVIPKLEALSCPTNVVSHTWVSYWRTLSLRVPQTG